MEGIDDLQMPVELWSYILRSVNDLEDLYHLRLVNKLFNGELSKIEPLEMIRDVNWDQAVVSKLRARVLPNLSDYQIREYFKLAKPAHVLRAEPYRHYFFRIILLGSIGVGKSTLCRSFERGYLVEQHTIRQNFTKEWNNLEVSSRAEIFDQADEQVFRSPPPHAYYRCASGALLCFSIDNRRSFIELIDHYFEPLSRLAQDNVVCYLIGTKSDVTQREVSRVEAQTVARACSMKYFEVSSKQYHNINEMFNSLNIDLLRAMKLEDLNEVVGNPEPKHGATNQQSRCNVM